MPRGAGGFPPELAGRDELRETIAIDRCRSGRSARSLLMVGLRGVGKTVLLEQVRRDAEASGVRTVKIEAKEDRSLPAMLLPELRKALLRLSDVDRLSAADAATALVNPARDKGVEYTEDAVRAIVAETEGYPFFLQVWGTECWNTADASPITRNDVERARKSAIADLDASFFKVRFDRMTPVEKRYLRAMAELGPGPHRSGDIAEMLGRKVTSVAPTRSNLIAKGMIWSPSHGDTAFTVPLFDGFMKRIMPDDDWRD